MSRTEHQDFAFSAFRAREESRRARARYDSDRRKRGLPETNLQDETPEENRAVLELFFNISGIVGPKRKALYRAGASVFQKLPDNI